MDKIARLIREPLSGNTIFDRQCQLLKWFFAKNVLTILLKETAGKQGKEWVEFIVNSLKIRCETYSSNYAHIPEYDQAIIFSNHPTVLGGLTFFKTVSVLPKDIKIVANHAFSLLFPSTKIISIGIRNMGAKIIDRQSKDMNDHLQKGSVLIIGPADHLANLFLKDLCKSLWYAGFIQLVCKNNAALIPVHIKGINTLWYYFLASIWCLSSDLIIIHKILRHGEKRPAYLPVLLNLFIRLKDLLKQDAVFFRKKIKNQCV